MVENTESGIPTIKNTEKCKSEGIEEDPGFVTNVSQVPQLSNDTYDKVPRKEEGMVL